MSPQNKVLVVGAGATGVVTGFHFSREHEVSFYVRESRRQKIQDEKDFHWKLYDYDHKCLHRFDRFEVISSMEEVKDRGFDFVIMALDYFSLLAKDGQELLRGLASACSESTVFIALQPGLDIRQIYTEAGVQNENVVVGSFIFLSHPTPMPGQPSASEFPGLDDEEIDYAFHLLEGRGTMFVLGKSHESRFALKKFSKAMKQANLNAQVFKESILLPSMMIIFPLNLAIEVAGWRNPEKETLTIATGAVKELLRTYGFIGKLMSYFMSNFLSRKILKLNETKSLPIEIIAFTKFHHGMKVKQQNIRILEAHREKAHQMKMETPNIDAMLEAMHVDEETH